MVFILDKTGRNGGQDFARIAWQPYQSRQVAQEFNIGAEIESNTATGK
jgi:hypothetical protein